MTDRTLIPRHGQDVVDGIPDTCPTCRSIAIRVEGDEWLCEICRAASRGWLGRPAPGPGLQCPKCTSTNLRILGDEYRCADCYHSTPGWAAAHMPLRPAEDSGSGETATGGDAQEQAALGPSALAVSADSPPRNNQRRGRDLTSDELIAFLHAAVKDGRSPSRGKWDTGERPDGAPTAYVYVGRFGSWAQALAAAGLEPNSAGTPKSQPATTGPIHPAALVEKAAPPPPPDVPAVPVPAGEAPGATPIETPAQNGVVEAVLPASYAQTPVRLVASQPGFGRVDRSNVEHPPHYKAGGIETIDVIEAYGLSFHLGNVVKYVLRHDQKGGLEDLHKARWYLDRYIAHLEGDV